MSLFKLITPKAFLTLTKNPPAGQRVIPVDSTWFLPNLNRDGREEFKEIERIPGAVFFDIDGICDTKSKYPHMLPSLDIFNNAMSKLGLKENDILVVYDRIGNFSAPRCAWTIGLFGHANIYLLNNFNVYKGLELTLDTDKQSEFSKYPPTKYHSSTDLTKNRVVTYEQVMKLSNDKELHNNYNAFDARLLGRFEGVAPEPRPGLPSGHISGFQPLPFTDVLNPTNQTYPEDEEQMKEKLKDAMSKLDITIDPKKPTIVMCGTGVTGAIIQTALELSGMENVALYDGSWTEWALRCDPECIKKNRD